MLDEGETDWKVLAIATDDPLFSEINSLADLEQHQPGKVAAITHWFRMYKTPDGKPENQFAFDGQAQSAKYAHQVIAASHDSWKQLTATGNKKLWTR